MSRLTLIAEIITAIVFWAFVLKFYSAIHPASEFDSWVLWILISAVSIKVGWELKRNFDNNHKKSIFIKYRKK